MGGEINIVENPHSHSLHEYTPPGFIKDGRAAHSMKEEIKPTPHAQVERRRLDLELGGL